MVSWWSTLVKLVQRTATEIVLYSFTVLFERTVWLWGACIAAGHEKCFWSVSQGELKEKSQYSFWPHWQGWIFFRRHHLYWLCCRIFSLVKLQLCTPLNLSAELCLSIQRLKKGHVPCCFTPVWSWHFWLIGWFLIWMQTAAVGVQSTHQRGQCSRTLATNMTYDCSI